MPAQIPAHTPALPPSVNVPQLLDQVPMARVRFMSDARTAPPVRKIFPKETAVVGKNLNQSNRPMVYGHYSSKAPNRSAGINSKITAIFPVVVPRTGDGTASPAITKFLQALLGGQSPRYAIDNLLQNPRGDGSPILPAIGNPEQSPCTLPPVSSLGQSQPAARTNAQKRSSLAPRHHCWARQCNAAFKSRSELQHHLAVHHQCLRLLLIDPYPRAGKPAHRGGASSSWRRN